MKVTRTSNGYAIPVKVNAGASADRIQGEHGGRLKVSVAAPAEKGKANDAVRSLLAERLAVRDGDVTIVSGETSTHKRLHIAGVDRDALRTLLQ